MTPGRLALIGVGLLVVAPVAAFAIGYAGLPDMTVWLCVVALVLGVGLVVAGVALKIERRAKN